MPYLCRVGDYPCSPKACVDVEYGVFRELAGIRDVVPLAGQRRIGAMGRAGDLGGKVVLITVGALPGPLHFDSFVLLFGQEQPVEKIGGDAMRGGEAVSWRSFDEYDSQTERRKSSCLCCPKK